MWVQDAHSTVGRPVHKQAVVGGLCGLCTCNQPWALSANVPDPERIGVGPRKVIPDCSPLDTADLD